MVALFQLYFRMIFAVQLYNGWSDCFFFSRKSFDLYFRIIQQLPSVGLFFIYFFIFLDVGFAVVISKYIKYTMSRTCIYISLYIHSQQFHTRVYLKSLFREISVKKNLHLKDKFVCYRKSPAILRFFDCRPQIVTILRKCADGLHANLKFILIASRINHVLLRVRQNGDNVEALDVLRNKSRMFSKRMLNNKHKQLVYKYT